MKGLHLSLGLKAPEIERKHLTLKEFEDLYISHVLELYEGNITRTAEALGVTRRTLQRKIAKGLLVN